MNRDEPTVSRRRMMCDATRFVALGGIVSFTGWLAFKRTAQAGGCPDSAETCSACSQAAGCSRPQVWQIDPDRCIACGRCQTNCVLDLSAVKAVNCFALCGYCDNCTGYFPTKDYVLDTGAENQLCPTGAITRKFIEKQSGVPYFEYTIDENLCIACGKCVVGCRLMNGSLSLQVRHDRCLNCNECSIAVGCPADAFRRVPATAPRLLRREAKAAEEALARKHSSRENPKLS
jgi:electron transport complex protein RnfB